MAFWVVLIKGREEEEETGWEKKDGKTKGVKKKKERSHVNLLGKGGKSDAGDFEGVPGDSLLTSLSRKKNKQVEGGKRGAKVQIPRG